jgi:3-methyladenine DNA glycosylase/8-oxoguanine DNA glycosylase
MSTVRRSRLCCAFLTSATRALREPESARDERAEPPRVVAVARPELAAGRADLGVELVEPVVLDAGGLVGGFLATVSFGAVRWRSTGHDAREYGGGSGRSAGLDARSVLATCRQRAAVSVRSGPPGPGPRPARGLRVGSVGDTDPVTTDPVNAANAIAAAVAEWPARSRVWRSARPVAVPVILSTLRHGGGDPTFLRGRAGAVVRGLRTPEGPVTLELRPRPADGEVVARAWGAGANWTLDGIPDLLGEQDDASGFVPHHDLVAQAARRFTGWRVPRSRLVLESLVPAVIEQKVTGKEAFAGFRQLVRQFGERAPGPYASVGLLVQPAPTAWAAIPSWQFLTASVDPGRSRTLLGAVRAAGRLEQTVDMSPLAARARMQALPGVGAWTSAEVAQRALGDADAVSFGDYHVAQDITWALLGEAHGDDVLAELLEPYAGHRYRVQRLLELSGVRRPRRGPRMAPRTHLPH